MIRDYNQASNQEVEEGLARSFEAYLRMRAEGLDGIKDRLARLEKVKAYLGG